MMLGIFEILIILLVLFVMAGLAVGVVLLVVWLTRREKRSVAATAPGTGRTQTPQAAATCPRCGTMLPPESPQGLCPRCVLGVGLATHTEAGSESGPHGTKVLEPPPAATDIAKHFPQLEILECLGRGGMGVVYKARQPKLNRLVALKILAPEKGADPKFAERFLREAQALARLNHANIVTVHDFGEANGLYFLLMEYVDGMTLRQLLQGQKIAPEQALAIVPKICEALQFAHEQGVVHRDIKPENVLLDKQGRVKIADFGIAKIVAADQPQQAITQDQVVGTPHYMAPEQVERPQLVDHRADIYSLGVVFYEMLTGELPLGKFQPPSKKVQVDVRLDEVVLHALEKEPERRYQRASEVKTAVETIVSTPAPEGQPAGGAALAQGAELEGRMQRGLTQPAPKSVGGWMFLLGGCWLLLAIIVLLGKKVARGEPLMYAFFGVGGYLYPDSYHAVIVLSVVFGLGCLWLGWMGGQGAVRQLSLGVIGASPWMVVMFALVLGKQVMRWEPVMYAFFGVGGWMYPSSYNWLIGGCLLLAVASFGVIWLRFQRDRVPRRNGRRVGVALAEPLARCWRSWLSRRASPERSADTGAARKSLEAGQGWLTVEAAKGWVTAARWTARVLGTLLLGIYGLFVIGEGLPPMGSQPEGVQLSFVAVGLMLLGFVLGWKKEGTAALLIASGWTLWHIAEGRISLNAFQTPLPVAALYGLCWWATQGRKTHIALAAAAVLVMALILGRLICPTSVFVRGLITDAETGKPIPNAELTLERVTPSRSGKSKGPNARSRKDGRFDLYVGWYAEQKKVAITAPGYEALTATLGPRALGQRNVNRDYQLSRAGVARGAELGPVVERVLYSVATQRPIKAEDLDSGREIEVPPEMEKAGEDQFFHWLAAQGADLLAFAHKESWELWASPKLVGVPPALWGEATADQLRSALKSGTMGFGRASLDVKEGFAAYQVNETTVFPQTLAFQTGSGGLGLLQINGFAENPRGMKICYRLTSGAGRAEARTDEDFVAEHRAELGQKALDAARAFVEEHKWKMQSEWGNQLRVVLKATDPAGKQITFEEAATANGTARFTVIAEPGAELSAQRIGAALWRRLGWVYVSPGLAAQVPPPPVARAEAGTYQVTLTNGITVEVVAVARNPLVSWLWWKPDGTPLPQPPGEAREFQPAGMWTRKSVGSNDCAILVRYGGQLTPNWRRGQQYTPRGEFIGHFGVKGVGMADVVRFPAHTKEVALGVATAADGPWEPVAVFDGSRTRVLIEGIQVLCTHLRHDPDGKCLDVSHNVDRGQYALRMMARFKNIGRREVGLHSVVLSARESRGYVVLDPSEPDLRAGDILEFVLERTPWVSGEIHGIALAPRRDATLTPPSFGPAIEREVGGWPSLDCTVLDLDQGRLLVVPTNTVAISMNNPRPMLNWMVQQGADLTVQMGAGAGLHLDDGVLLRLEGDVTFESVAASTVRRQLSSSGGAQDMSIPREELKAQPVFVYRTREGGMGVLQVLGPSQDPRSLRIRFKAALSVQ